MIPGEILSRSGAAVASLLPAACAFLWTGPASAQSIDEWTVALKNTRDGGLRPAAVVIRKRDFGPSLAFSIYRHVDARGERRTPRGWRVRRDVLDDEGVRTAWASSADCPALPALVEDLQSSSPRLELLPP